MCVIAVLPVGTTITEVELRNMWNNNDDGAGFMFVNPITGNIAVKKYMKYEKFKQSFFDTWDKYKSSSPFVLHFRIGTHGTETIDNVHPFRVNDNVAFCHNGILTNCVTVNDHRSDTRVFNDTFMANLPHNFLRNPSIMHMVHELIGCTYNKLVFLTRDKEVVILNKSLGVESEGRWFSNHSFRASSNVYGYGTPYAWDYDDDFYTGGYPNYISAGGQRYDIETGERIAKRASGDTGDAESKRVTADIEEWCALCKEYVYYRDFDYGGFQACDECVIEFKKYPKKIRTQGEVSASSLTYGGNESSSNKWIKEWAKQNKAKFDALNDIANSNPEGVYSSPNKSTHAMTVDEWNNIKNNRLNEKLGVGL